MLKRPCHKAATKAVKLQYGGGTTSVYSRSSPYRYTAQQRPQGRLSARRDSNRTAAAARRTLWAQKWKEEARFVSGYHKQQSLRPCQSSKDFKKQNSIRLPHSLYFLSMQQAIRLAPLSFPFWPAFLASAINCHVFTGLRPSFINRVTLFPKPIFFANAMNEKFGQKLGFDYSL